MDSNVLREFFEKYLGLANIQLDYDTPVALTLENNATALLEKKEDSVKISILKELDEFRVKDVATKLLKTCHFSNKHPIKMQPGFLPPNRITISTYITWEDLALPELGKSLDYLIETLNSIDNGVK